jgi:diguanylate cyclase (GGDEF)-like protein
MGTWPVIAALTVVVLVAGFYAMVRIRGQVEKRVVDGAVHTSGLVMSLTINPKLSEVGEELVEITPAVRAEIDADVEELKRDNTIIGLEVWGLDGRLIYGDPGRNHSETIMPLDELARGRLGQPFVARVSLERDGKDVLAVFLPYDPDFDGIHEGIVEVLFPHDEIRQAVDASNGLMATGGATFAAVLLLSLYGLRRRYKIHEARASQDPLTGLGNWLLLTKHHASLVVDNEIGVPALLLIGLDGFKRINNLLGRNVGDEVLIAVAEALRGACRDSDQVVRVSGDEFAIVTTVVTGAAGASDYAQRVRTALRQPITVSGVAMEIDASIGVALAPQHGRDITTLLRHADIAMHLAKRQGSEIEVFDGTVEPHDAQHLTLLAELRRGIAEGQLRLYYQPKATIGGRVHDVEALVRWQHPERGLLAPDAFLALAEETSIIRPLTAWVLNEAARQCAAWRKSGLELRVAANVSSRNLSDDDLPAAVLRAATAAGISVTDLQIEITETSVISDPAQAAALLGQLRAMGVSVAIDDFGAGYTSLALLQTLPIDTLKIDRRFITHLIDNPGDRAVVRNVVQLAHDLGIASLAEGVESPNTWAMLADLGCDEIQGYVLSPPLPPAQLVQWLADWTFSQQALTHGVTSNDTVIIPIEGVL